MTMYPRTPPANTKASSKIASPSPWNHQDSSLGERGLIECSMDAIVRERPDPLAAPRGQTAGDHEPDFGVPAPFLRPSGSISWVDNVPAPDTVCLPTSCIRCACDRMLWLRPYMK